MNDDETTPVRPEELLVHRAWVRSLARRLVRDENAADDVEQETWATALARGPASRASLRGWLGTVVRSRRRDAHRASSRRTDRETDAARELRALHDRGAEPAAEVAARAEAHKLVVDAVLRLPPPYRDVVLHCYFEGRTPSEVAALHGVPASTVRTRLARALDRLRGDLDRAHDGDRELWCTAVLPLVGMPDRTPSLPGTAARVAATASAAALLGVAAVGALAVLAVRDAPGPGDSSSGRPPGPVARRTDARAAGPESGRPAADDSSAAAAAPGTPTGAGGGGTTADDAAIVDAAPGTLVVRVVDARSGEAVPSALLRSATVADEDADALLAAEDLFDRLGAFHESRSDPRGDATVEAGVGALVLCARSGGREGRARLDVVTADGFRLAMSGPCEATVRVEEPDGSPAAGAVVRLVATSPFRPAVLRETVAGPDGTARLGHLAEPLSGARGDTLSLEVPLAAEAPVGLSVTASSLPGGVFTIRLPETACVVAEVVDECDRLVETPVQVRLRRADRADAPPLCAVTSGGRATFGRLAPGAAFVLQAADPDCRRATVSATCTSPDAGGLARARLVVGGPRGILRGRLVEASGRPVPGRSLWCATDGTDAPAPVVCVTGADGAFEFRPDAGPSDLAGGTARLLERIGASAGLRDLCEVRLDAVAPTNGIFDLGALVRDRAPVAARGTVVDPDGVPVAGAVVGLVAPEEGIDPETADDVTVSDADGRFEMHARDVPPQAVLVASRHGRYLERPASPRGASEETVVVLGRAGGIAGRVVLPTGADPEDVRVLVEDGGPFPVSVAVGADCGFSCATLRPGTATVRVHADGRPETEVRIVGVEVVAGVVRRDVRLARIELGSSGTQARPLQVLDAAGAAVADAELWFRLPGADLSWTREAVDVEGRAVPQHARVAEVVVVAPGRRAVRLVDAPLPERVVLERATPDTVVVRLARPLRTGDEGVRLVVRADWLAAPGRPAPDEPDAFDPLNAAGRSVPADVAHGTEIAVADAGTWRFVLAVERRLGDEIRWAEVGRPTDLAVRARGDRVAVELDADEDELRRALAEL